MSRLFGISIDELIADDDIESKRLLDEAEDRRYYWYAIMCLGIVTVSAVVSSFVKIPYLNILSILGVIGYVIFGIRSKPRYKRLSAKKMIVPYIVSRLVVLAVVIIVIVTTILQM